MKKTEEDKIVYNFISMFMSGRAMNSKKLQRAGVEDLKRLMNILERIDKNY